MAVLLLNILIAMVLTGVASGPLNANPCNEKEYKHQGECCPMCKSGQRVQEHCTQLTGTQCYPCASNTYQDNFNGQKQCIVCKACGEGMYDIDVCNVARDTICDCLDGFHCDKLTSEGCEKCTKHRTCPAGEVMRRKGTYRQDTMCHPSPSGIDSLEESTAKDSKTEPTPGSAPADSECSKYRTALICVSVLCVLIVTIVVVFNFRKAKDLWNRLCSGGGVCSKETGTRDSNKMAFNQPVQEQGQEDGPSLPLSVQEASADNSSTHTKPIFDPTATMKEPSGKLYATQHLDREETIPMMSSVKTICDNAELTDALLQ